MDSELHPAARSRTSTGTPQVAAADVLAARVLWAPNCCVSTPALLKTSLNHLARVSLLTCLCGFWWLSKSLVSLPRTSFVLRTYSFSTDTTHSLLFWGKAKNSRGAKCFPFRVCFSGTLTLNTHLESLIFNEERERLCSVCSLCPDSRARSMTSL